MTIEYSAVRSIPPKTKGNRGYFPSNKVNSLIVEYESQIERDFYLLLEHAPDVIQYQHQPIKIKYKNTNNKFRNYTPDVYLEFDNGLRALVEIKDQQTLDEDYKKFKFRWDAAQVWSQERGYLFKVLTENQIRNERLANIWFTLSASKNPNNNKYVTKLKQLIPTVGQKFNTLCNSLSEGLGVEIGYASQIICYAIYHGLVFVDTFSTKLLSANTIIRKRSRLDTYPFRSLWEEIELKYDNNVSFPTDNRITEELIGNQTKLTALIPQKYQNTVENRLKIVKAWLKQSSKNRTADWRLNFYDKWNVKKSTIFRWAKDYKKHGIEGLIPQHSKAGRKSKFDSQAMNLLEKARKRYLTAGGTLRNSYQWLVDNWSHSSLAIPTQSTFYWFISQNTTSSELAYHKRGKQFHKSHYTPSLKSFQGANMPMQVLQIDSTSFDVFPVDSKKKKSLPTPYLTASIDCYTRMITGFYLSLSPNSSQSILECLVQTILPKNKYTQISKTKNEWLIQGFPTLILVDNGLDYRSAIVKDFCMKYDIILEYVPLRTPRYKAYIEQWFNILRLALKEEEVPGYRYLLKKRLENPELKPQANAVLTLQQLEIWLTLWIVDKYHFTNPYNDHVAAPYLRWLDAQLDLADPIYPLPRQPPKEKFAVDLLYLSTLTKETRILQNDGIQWDYLKYNNTELAKTYATIGFGIKVSVLRDRRDIRNVWVINPTDEKPIFVGLAGGWASAIVEVHDDNPINASAWKSDLQKIKSNLQARLTPYLYQMEMGKLARKKLLKNANKETKRERKQQEILKENRRKLTKNKLKSALIATAMEKIKIKSPKKKRRLSSDDIEVLPFDEKRRV